MNGAEPLAATDTRLALIAAGISAVLREVHEMNQLQSEIAMGALAGLAGTAVITVMMHGMAPKMVPQDRRPAEFPPKSVVEAGEKQVDRPNALRGREWQTGDQQPPRSHRL
jgi:hypothetical protein